MKTFTSHSAGVSQMEDSQKYAIRKIIEEFNSETEKHLASVRAIHTRMGKALDGELGLDVISNIARNSDELISHGASIKVLRAAFERAENLAESSDRPVHDLSAILNREVADLARNQPTNSGALGVFERALLRAMGDVAGIVRYQAEALDHIAARKES